MLSTFHYICTYIKQIMKYYYNDLLNPSNFFYYQYFVLFDTLAELSDCSYVYSIFIVISQCVGGSKKATGW